MKLGSSFGQNNGLSFIATAFAQLPLIWYLAENKKYTSDVIL